ncbi:bacillithiol transferase BstA [Bacillus sp. APMAM]|nr:bacillithiol transferase BstA [Bacillus sp. APMAM]RTZ53406.1 putative metal-dependent hydrolase [Bacillus sp. SAJ1]
MDEKYPIGTFQYDGELDQWGINNWIKEIEDLPNQLHEAVKELNDNQLDTPYREGGWTVRQVVHHIADSHLNAYVRMKLALTEEKPTIKPYEEGKWAELTDYSLPAEISLHLLESLHQRWAYLLRNLNKDDLVRTFIHPELGEVSIEKNIGLYASHGKHHLAHITSLCRRMGW